MVGGTKSIIEWQLPYFYRQTNKCHRAFDLQSNTFLTKVEKAFDTKAKRHFDLGQKIQGAIISVLIFVY